MGEALRVWRKRLIRATVAAALAALAAQAATYVVAPGGSDDSSGTIRAPWRTVARAARTLGAGDTVLIRAGVYREQVLPGASGAAGRLIVYQAYPGEAPVIDGTGVTLNGIGLVTVSGRSYIKLSGLTVQNSREAGICVINAHHIWVHRNRTYNTVSSGIISSEFGVNHHIYVDSNDVELACNDGGQECVSFAKTDSFEISNNHVHHGGPGTNGGEGMDVKFGCTNGKVFGNVIHHMNRQGLYVDAWNTPVRNIELYGNIVYRCQFGFCIATEQPGGTIDNINFHHNLIYDCERTAIMISPWGSSDNLRSNIAIVNNTIAANGWRRVAAGGPPQGGMLFETSNVQNVTIANNIFSNNCSFQLATRVDLAGKVTTAYNMFDGYNQAPPKKDDGTFFPSNTGVNPFSGTNVVAGTPDFRDTSRADYRLLASSDAINAGDPAARYNDPDGSRNDLGAYWFDQVAAAWRRGAGLNWAQMSDRAVVTVAGVRPGRMVWPAAVNLDLRGAMQKGAGQAAAAVVVRP